MRSNEQLPRGRQIFGLRTGERRTAVADRVIAPEAPPGAPSIPPEVKVKPKAPRIGTKARIGLATLAALGTVETTGAVVNEQVNEQPVSAQTIKADLAWPWNLGKSATEDIKRLFSKNKVTAYEGTLAPKESVSWWQELPQEKIQSLAQIPSINILGEEHKSAVSPSLQQRARDAGYEIIYQGDPNDTTGRTVIAKGRQGSNKDWTEEDQGFGRAGATIRGILTAWVPDPEDPTQKDHVYALVIDPMSKKETLVRLELKQFDPNSNIRPTWFTIDDLYNGPSQIERRSKEVGRQPGQELSTDGLPSPSDPPLKQSKKLTDFPTFDDLLRKEALSLTNLAMPGDYVKIGMQTAGVDETKGQYRYKTDENGISRAIIFGIRRFGGENQWKSELSTSPK